MSSTVAPPEVVPRGDTFDARYRDEAPGAMRLAYLLTGDPVLAEDIVHDAFVRVAGRLRSIRDHDAFGAYLRRAVVNLARSHFRHQRVVRRHLERGTGVVFGQSPEAEVDARHALWEALQRLPQRQRAAVVCRYYLDLPERVTATVLGCRPGTVKSSLARGLAALRAILGEERERP